MMSRLQLLLPFLSVFLVEGFRREASVARVLLSAALKTRSSALKLAEQSFLHLSEYPKDNFSHILGFGTLNHTQSKLQEISSRCIEDVIRNKKPIDALGCGIDRSFYVSSDDLLEEIFEFDQKYGSPLNLYDRLRSAKVDQSVHIATEFKRASPSKGDINVGLNTAEHCTMYAEMGASVISVLTEFRYFKGNLQDMKAVRLAVQSKFGESLRPLILRKDFIFDRYQVLEARAHGADTLLLIVAVLGVNQLKDLIQFSRQQGMEPLVEVNTVQEMEIALDAGAKVIGVNNRNLHSFQLDMSTTERCMAVLSARGLSPNDICIAALSGISNAQEVRHFLNLGVKCCLVGETLMRATDPRAKIDELLGRRSSMEAAAMETRRFLKVCGMTDADQVRGALQAGANAIGVIFASQSKRKIDVDAAHKIVEVVRKFGERTGELKDIRVRMQEMSAIHKISPKEWFKGMAESLQMLTVRRPITIGVFQNHSPEEINAIVAQTGVDLVQLHGSEDVSFAERLNVPVIKVLHIDVEATADEVEDAILSASKHWNRKAIALLLDAKSSSLNTSGGLGKTFNWSTLRDLSESATIPLLLAGGIRPENLPDSFPLMRRSLVFGVDVNSGVEDSQPGNKDVGKIRSIAKALCESN